MSRSPTDVELVMRDFRCRCGANRGEPCRTKSGRRRSNSHAGRYQSAVEEGRLPFGPNAPRPTRP